MYADIKKLLHSLVKSIRQKQQKAAEKAAQKAAEKGPRQQKPPQQDQQRPQLEDDGTYNQRNKEKADSNTSRCSSLVVNLDAQAKTNNTYSRDLTAVLTHSDTQAQMSVANKPNFVQEFTESQVTLVGIGKGSGIPAHISKLSFVLKAENKSTYTLETEGVYSKEASTVVLFH